MSVDLSPTVAPIAGFDGEQLYRLLVANLPDTTAMLFDRDGIYRLVEGEGAEMLNLKTLLGRRVDAPGGPVTEKMAETLAANYTAVLAGARREFDLPYRERVIHVCAAPLYDDNGQVCAGVASARDITGQADAIRHLAHMAHYDTLTGLANRVLCADTLTAAVRSAAAGVPAVLCMLDLDNFKAVNDSLGHDTGDELLQLIAERLRIAVRHGDFVARLSGDEFAVIAENLDADDIPLVLDRIVEQVGQPAHLRGQSIFPGVSVGAVAIDGDSDPTELLRAADIAMYDAKAAGGRAYRFFAPEMSDRAQAKLRLTAQLHDGLSAGEFVMQYQPQMDVASGEVRSVEALMRWQRDGALVAPDQFIPVAESSGFIVTLGAWALDEVCRQAAQWHRAGLHLRVAVNVSPVQLHEPDFPGLVAAALARHELPPHLLELEITETALADNEVFVGALDALRNLAVILTIDDFGTGYSSLGRLQRHPLDSLKIDRSFIAASDSADGQAIVRALIGLGKALRMTVLGEGVETVAQHAFLAAEGCDMCSGWLFSPAVAPAAAAAYARNHLGVPDVIAA